MQLDVLANIGLPAGAEQLLIRGGQTAFVITVASLGTLAYRGASDRAPGGIDLLHAGLWLRRRRHDPRRPGPGTRDPDAADGRLAQWMAVVIMSGMGLIFFLFPAHHRHLHRDPRVIQLGIWPLRLVAFSLSQPMLATMMVLGGPFRGTGDTRTTLAITAGGALWLVRVPLAVLLVPRFGLIGRRGSR